MKQGVLFKGVSTNIKPVEKTEDLTNIEIVHCRICGRVLKNSTSKIEGIGPTCKDKVKLKCPVRQLKLV